MKLCFSIRYFRWMTTFFLMTSLLIFLSVDTTNRRSLETGNGGSEAGNGGERHRLVSLLGVGFVVVVSALVKNSKLSKGDIKRWDKVFLKNFWMLGNPILSSKHEQLGKNESKNEPEHLLFVVYEEKHIFGRICLENTDLEKALLQSLYSLLQ